MRFRRRGSILRKRLRASSTLAALMLLQISWILLGGYAQRYPFGALRLEPLRFIIRIRNRLPGKAPFFAKSASYWITSRIESASISSGNSANLAAKGSAPPRSTGGGGSGSRSVLRRLWISANL